MTSSTCNVLAQNRTRRVYKVDDMIAERNKHHTHTFQMDLWSMTENRQVRHRAQSSNSMEARCGTSGKEKSSFPSLTRRPSSSSTIVQLSTLRCLIGRTVRGVRNKNGMADSSESVSEKKSRRGHGVDKFPLESDIASESDKTSSGVPAC